MLAGACSPLILRTATMLHEVNVKKQGLRPLAFGKSKVRVRMNFNQTRCLKPIAFMKWSCSLGQICGLAKMHRVCGHAAFRISAWSKYAVSGVRLSRAV